MHTLAPMKNASHEAYNLSYHSSSSGKEHGSLSSVAAVLYPLSYPFLQGRTERL